MITAINPAYMRGKIFLLMLLPFAIFVACAALFLPFVDYNKTRDEWARQVAGEISIVARQAENATSPVQASQLIELSNRPGFRVEYIQQDLLGQPFDAWKAKNASWVDRTLVERILSRLDDAQRFGSDEMDVPVAIDAARALQFRMALPQGLPSSLQALFLDSGIVALFAIGVICCSVYMSGRITLPLTAFASAAVKISKDLQSDENFVAQGSEEIVSLAKSLNKMREHVNKSMVLQTDLIKALGHDLRTPLTRLRMRAERSTDLELRRLMLVDISMMAAMIEEFVAFLSNAEGGREVFRKIDLSSLLQTITTDYADTGIVINFSGPRRLISTCQPRALTRALQNLIDNASHYSAEIDMFLEKEKDGCVVIEVCDRGPGIPDALKEKVIEPFYKGNAARTLGNRSGTGLGLSIANGIICNAGGTLTLLDRDPAGLIVRIMLPVHVGQRTNSI